MVTAPLLTVGVQVDLPESAADSLPDDQEPLTLSINSKGEVFIQEHKVTYNKIIPKLLAIAKSDSENGNLIGFVSYEILGMIEKYIRISCLVHLQRRQVWFP